MLNFVDISKACAKVLLLVLDVPCILIGLCTFGFAVMDIQVQRQCSEEQSAGSISRDVVLIVASLMLIAVAILGCIETGRESVKMFYLYVGFLLIMVILELLITIYVLVQRYGLQFGVTEDWIREHFYRNVTAEEKEHHVNLWNGLQTTYECCGLNGPDDNVALGQPITMSTVTYYKYICEDEILDNLRSEAAWMLGVAVLSFWIEAANIIYAMWESSHL